MRFWFILMCCISTVLAQREPRPVLVTDSSAIVWLLADANSSIHFSADAEWSIVPSMDSLALLAVLMNGTEVHRLDSARTQIFMDKNLGLFSQSVSEKSSTWMPVLSRTKPSWKSLMESSLDDMQGPWYGWTQGVDLNWGLYSARGDRWWIRDYWNVEASYIYKAFRAHASWTSYSDYMNIQRAIRDYYGKENFSNQSWGIGISWRGITLSAQNTGWVLPEYYWLENNLDSLLTLAVDNPDSATGTVINQFAKGFDNGHESNVSYAIQLRLWYLRYSQVLDGDVYSNSVHRIAVEDFPTGFGTGGVSVVLCNGIAAPGFWLELGPLIDKKVPVQWMWNQVRWYPIRFAFEYLNTTHFRLELSTRIWIGTP